ncbi:MAG TPA: hypothetical protein VIC84_02240 [Blastocatellia bacterium]|jgi:hypothetical protein
MAIAGIRALNDITGTNLMARRLIPVDSIYAPGIVDRVNTDFLWQRSPFLLFGGGAGAIETAGIDYILPYWMARYYGINVD